MFGLLAVPYEVLANIVGNLEFDDVFSLGQTCKDFQFLLLEESISKAVVQTKIRYTNEAREATKATGGNASALRRVAKRRAALATASPFIVATVGFCDAYLYCKGVLCYTLDDKIRILNLHHSGRNELVISIPGLLTQALPEIGDKRTGLFQVLHYSNYIISCLYKSSGPDPTAWLVSFHLRTRAILLSRELDSTEKIFVRHNKQYLYYGTHSEIGNDGNKKWVVYGFNFTERKWFNQKVHLQNMVGSEIGSTICFEIFDGYFYALSNQTSFEVEEIDWTSFYHCIRFPLSSPCEALVEKTENKSMWRRQHQEGPIDDRWTTLSLDKDESTGKIRIVEARKEWYLGSSKSQRTYYKTDICFPKAIVEDLALVDLQTISYIDSAIAVGDPYTWSSGTDPSTGSASTTALSSSATSGFGSTSTSSTLYSSQDFDSSELSNEPLLRLLDKEDHPHHMRAPRRLPQNTHPGDDGMNHPIFTLAKSLIRTYHTSCNTFMDLVDDPLESDWQGRQRLRLRAGTRTLGPLLRHNKGPMQGLLRDPHEDLAIALSEMYRVPEITFWPAAQDPKNPDENLDAIYKLLNPPSHLGDVEGTADERSIVYVTGRRDQPQALIFVGFDPAIRLAGLKGWGSKGVGEGPHIDGRASGDCTVDIRPKRIKYIDPEEKNRTIGIDREEHGKGKEAERSRTLVDIPPRGKATPSMETSPSMVNMAGTSRCKWVWKEKAMYQDINLGFHFGLEHPKKL